MRKLLRLSAFVVLLGLGFAAASATVGRFLFYPETVLRAPEFYQRVSHLPYQERPTDIVREVLADHDEMDPDFPPRVFFNDFNRDSFNIRMILWYHPSAYWDFLAFSQVVNQRIVEAFEAEEIRFALPASAGRRNSNVSRTPSCPWETAVGATRNAGSCG
jgi:hypothetical protein